MSAELPLLTPSDAADALELDVYKAHAWGVLPHRFRAASTEAECLLELVKVDGDPVGAFRWARVRVELLEIVGPGETPLPGRMPSGSAAAQALRDAVLWLEEVHERSDPADYSRVVGGAPPRWYMWALRVLPASGLSRWGKLARHLADRLEL